MYSLKDFIFVLLIQSKNYSDRRYVAALSVLKSSDDLLL